MANLVRLSILRSLGEVTVKSIQLSLEAALYYTISLFTKPACSDKFTTIPMENYGSWSIGMLKAEFRKRNAKVLGRKKDIITRYYMLGPTINEYARMMHDY
jgi:predicted secreted acid phosphatase